MSPTNTQKVTATTAPLVTGKRRLSFFQVTKADVRALEEECDRKYLAMTKAVYFTLVELANDNRHHGPTFELACKDLAAKSGVGTTALRGAVKRICAAGLLTVEGGKRGVPNRWTVLSAEAEGNRSAVTPAGEGDRSAVRSGPEGDRPAASTRARPTAVRQRKPQRTTAAGKQTESSDGRLILERYIEVVAELRGGRRPSTKPGDERQAAALFQEHGREEIGRRLRWALEHDFWGDVVDKSFARFGGPKAWAAIGKQMPEPQGTILRGGWGTNYAGRTEDELAASNAAMDAEWARQEAEPKPEYAKAA